MYICIDTLIKNPAKHYGNTTTIQSDQMHVYEGMVKS